jgi:mercuric ion binding protein
MRIKIFSALILALLSAPVLATDYVIDVHGIVCSFCAKGVTKKVSKLPFIDRSKYNKGVKVEIEDQKVTIAVLPDQALDVDALYEAIVSGGYDPVKVFSIGENGELEEYRP